MCVCVCVCVCVCLSESCVFKRTCIAENEPQVHQKGHLTLLKKPVSELARAGALIGTRDYQQRKDSQIIIPLHYSLRVRDPGDAKVPTKNPAVSHTSTSLPRSSFGSTGIL